MFCACEFILLQQEGLLFYSSRELWSGLLEWLGPVPAGGCAGSSRRFSFCHSQRALPPLGEYAVRAPKAPARLPWAVGVQPPALEALPSAGQ